MLYRLSLISGSTEVLHNLYKASYTPSILAKQNIIFGSEDGEIYAYSINLKKIVWSYSLKKKESNLTTDLVFLNSNGDLVAVLYDKKLVVLRADNGAEVFSKYIKNGKLIVLDKDKIFLLSDNKIYTYSTLGQLLWFAEVGELFKTLMVYEPDNNILLVPSASKGILFAFDASSGSLLWFYSIEGFLMSQPTTDASTVLFGTNDGQIVGLDIKTGKEKYKIQTDEVLWGNGKKLAQRYAFYTSSKGNVIGVDINDGSMVFKHFIGSRSYYPLIINQKSILLPTTSNKIYYLSINPACSIFYPENSQEIGTSTILSGSVLSLSKPKNVQIFINKKPIPILNLEGKTFFSTSLDLTSSPGGEIELECLATDDKGELEKNELGYKVIGFFSELVTKNKIYVFIEPSINLNPGEEFSLYIQNQYSKNLDNIMINYLNEKKVVNSPYKLIAPKEPGVYKITVQKEGYETKEIYFEVKDNLFLLKVIGLIIISSAIYGFLIYLFKQK